MLSELQSSDPGGINMAVAHVCRQKLAMLHSSLASSFLARLQVCITAMNTCGKVHPCLSKLPRVDSSRESLVSNPLPSILFGTKWTGHSVYIGRIRAGAEVGWFVASFTCTRKETDGTRGSGKQKSFRMWFL